MALCSLLSLDTAKTDETGREICHVQAWPLVLSTCLYLAAARYKCYSELCPRFWGHSQCVIYILQRDLNP